MGSELYMLVTLTAGNWGVKVIHTRSIHIMHTYPLFPQVKNPSYTR